MLDLLIFQAREGLPKDRREVVEGEESSTSSPGEDGEDKGHAPRKGEDSP